MLSRIVTAIVVAIVVGLACLFIGGLLATLNVPPAEFAGNFLSRYAWVIGIAVGLLYGFFGGNLRLPPVA